VRVSGFSSKGDKVSTGSIFVISDFELEKIKRTIWMKPCADGSIEYYETESGDYSVPRTWSKILTIPAPGNHAHSDVSITVKAGKYDLKFENGILVKAVEAGG